MFKLLFKNMKAKHWVAVVFIFLLTLAEVYFMMTIVAYIGSLTAAVGNVQNDGTTAVWLNGLGMIVCAVAMVVVDIIIKFIASATASGTVTFLRQKLYERVNEFAIADFASFSTESLITRTTNDMQNVHLAWLTFLKTAFVAPVTMVWSIILLATQANGKLTIVTAIWVFLLVGAVAVLLLMVTPKFRIVQKLTDALNVSSRENLTGVRVVRAFNAETYQEGKFENVNAPYTKVQIFVGRVLAFFTPFVMMVMMGLSLSILWVSAYIINGLSLEQATLSFTSTNSFVMLASQIVMSFILVITLIVIWPRASVSAKRIYEVITHSVSVLDTDHPVDFKEKGTIEFKNVGFAYPGSDKEAVSNISFKVKKGETIAFIGATGSGKTTIINLIPRMADCTSGEVLVDGVNVKDYTQESLHNLLGYIPQKAVMFDGSVSSNVSYGYNGKAKASKSQIKKAIEVAQATDFVEKMDKKYESHIARGGTNVSGGQKQRLAIARAIARNPEIYIFDDSFSALDYKTDYILRKELKEYTKDATTLIVAQRIGTILQADKIIVLDEGKCVGIGTHKELLKTCDVYKQIALSQLSKEELEHAW